jgi:type II secretory pathway pseudopilin PulG
VHQQQEDVSVTIDIRGRRREHADGFTVIELVVAMGILLLVMGMFLNTLVALMHSEDRSQRLVSNEQNVRLELDQLQREIRAANPLVPLPNATAATDYNNQIELLLGPTGGTRQVVRWTYDTAREQMVRQVMSDTSPTATVVAQSFLLVRVRNVETGTPVFSYYDAAGTDLVARAISADDPAICALRVHIQISSDSNPGPLPFTETQDVELRNRLPGIFQCQP